MTAGGKYLYARVIKRSAVLALGLLVVWIAARFLVRRQGPADVIPEADTIVEQKVDRKENIQHFEVRGETGRIQVKADRYYLGDDRLNHLQGRVEVVDYGKKGGREIRILADHVAYDRELTRFSVGGSAKIIDRDVTLESASFDYDKKDEVFRTDKGVVFSSKKISGSCRKLTYALPSEELSLEEDLRMEIRTKLESTEPLRLEADAFSYKRREKTGSAGGNVKLGFGKSLGASEEMGFALTDDEERIKTLAFRSANGRASFILERGKHTRHVLEAGEIIVTAFPDEPKISWIEATGNAALKLPSETGQAAGRQANEIKAAKLKLLFFEDGELRIIEGAGGVAILVPGTGTGEGFSLSGDFLDFRTKSRVIRTDGTEGRTARLVSSRSEIQASQIRINPDTQNLQAIGAVRAILNPRAGDASFGFFSREKPVFISCGDMRHLETEKRFLFKEDVRIWQGKEILLAGELEVKETTGEISAAGGVKSVFPRKAKEGGGEERLEIGGDRMSYDPQDNHLFYEGNGLLNAKTTSLSSRTLSVRLKKDGGDMEKIVALGGVVISQEGREGRGEEAAYDFKEETIVLTGNPVLTDKNKGVTEGDKLTFHLGDGRIVIENTKRGRSVTVIKS